jgi:F-type H+-transporting ATPase subunit b
VVASSRLARSQLATQQLAAESTTTSVQAETIKSRYTPSGNFPTSYEYDQIPVELDGEKVSITDLRNANFCWPLLPQIDDSAPAPIATPAATKVEGEDETAAAPQSLEDELCVWFGHDMPTIYDDQKPERDLVNYPRQPVPMHPPPVRMAFLPESFFKYFHEKTGVTGPYLFMGTFGTFLISKEYLVLAEDAWNGLVLATVIGGVAYKFGPGLNKDLTAKDIKENQGWLDWQVGMIRFLEEYIQKNKEIQVLSVDQSILFEAKRENISLQREAEYRRRLMSVYQEAKRKLDYHVAVEEAQKQFAQGHLVNWVINNVNKGITPELQTSVLQQSITDLKNLSQKRKNAI